VTGFAFSILEHSAGISWPPPAQPVVAEVELVAAGANPTAVYEQLYESAPLARFKLLSSIAVGLPHEAIAEQVRRGIDLLVHLRRLPDGSRRVTEIVEVER